MCRLGNQRRDFPLTRRLPRQVTRLILRCLQAFPVDCPRAKLDLLARLSARTRNESPHYGKCLLIKAGECPDIGGRNVSGTRRRPRQSWKCLVVGGPPGTCHGRYPQSLDSPHCPCPDGASARIDARVAFRAVHGFKLSAALAVWRSVAGERIEDDRDGLSACHRSRRWPATRYPANEKP